MSYSTPSEKYRKYEDLLRKDPNNTVYSRKLNKYRTMLTKVSQRGGSRQTTTPRQNILDQILPNSPQPSDVQPASSNNGSGSQANDLIQKINSMVAYAQETGLAGGAKRTTHRTSNQGASRVKGYRKMVGGAVEEYKVPEQLTARTNAITNLKLLDEQDPNGAPAKKIINGVQKLKTEHDKSAEEIAQLNARIKTLESELEKERSGKQEVDTSIEKTKTDLTSLQTAYNALLKATKIADNDPATIEESLGLQEKAKIEIERLREEVVNLEKIATEKATQIQELEQQLKDVNETLAKHKQGSGETVTAYEGVVEEYEKRYNDLMNSLEGILNSSKSA